MLVKSMSWYVLDLYVYDPPANITKHIMLQFNSLFFYALKLYVSMSVCSKKIIDLELYI